METTYYECNCGKGLITKTVEVAEHGAKKIGVHPCGNCFNRPHIFHLNTYKISSKPEESKSEESKSIT